MKEWRIGFCLFVTMGVTAAFVLTSVDRRLAGRLDDASDVVDGLAAELARDRDRVDGLDHKLAKLINSMEQLSLAHRQLSKHRLAHDADLEAMRAIAVDETSGVREDPSQTSVPLRGRGVVPGTNKKTFAAWRATGAPAIFARIRAGRPDLAGMTRKVYENLLPALEMWSKYERYDGDYLEARLISRMFYTDWSFDDDTGVDAWAAVIEPMSGVVLTAAERSQLRHVLNDYSKTIDGVAKDIDRAFGITSELPFGDPAFDKASARRKTVYTEYYFLFLGDLRSALRPHQFEGIATVLEAAGLAIE